MTEQNSSETFEMVRLTQEEITILLFLVDVELKRCAGVDVDDPRPSALALLHNLFVSHSEQVR